MTDEDNTEVATFAVQFSCIDEKGNFLYDVVARFLETLDTYKTLKGSRKMYRYVKEYGYYKEDGKEHLDKQMRELVGTYYRTNRFKEVLSMVQLDTLIEPDVFVPPIRLVNLKNGYYDIQGKHFYQRYKEEEDCSSFYFQNCLPYEYHPIEYFGIDGPCPKIDKFFHEVLSNEEDITRMYEWFGFHLIRVYLFKKMAFFLGETNTAKSTVAQLLIAFLGKDSVSNVSMKKMRDVCSAHPKTCLPQTRGVCLDQ